MGARTYGVLTPVRFDDTLRQPGETVELPPDVDAGTLEADGVICDPGDPRFVALTPGSGPQPEADDGRAAIFDQALAALRAAWPEEVRDFLRRASEDPEIRAKAEPALDRRQELLAAIGALEYGNEAHWTKSGAPEVRALREATGLDDISAAERDAVWEQFQAAAD